MRSPGPARLLVSAALHAPALAACTWSDLDAVTLPAATAAPANDAAALPPEDAAEVTQADVSDDAQSAPTPTAACAPSETEPAQSWTFNDGDAGVDGWTVSSDTGVSASVTWTGATGNPSPGALLFAVTAGDGANQGAWLRNAASYGDLTGRTISAWLWLGGGPSPHLKLFVQTGSEYVWADGGTVNLAPQQWTCVSLSVSSPAYNGPEYDPTDVVNIGFETVAVDSFQLYVDTVQID
jgi:hypothetical protein